MSTQAEAAVEKMIFRRTNGQKGGHLAETPQNSAMRHLSYGRIILDASQPTVSFNNDDQQTGLIWPPHEHAKMLEERSPEPAYGIQLVYNNTHYPELVTVVRDRTFLSRAIESHSCGRWPRRK